METQNSGNEICEGDSSSMPADGAPQIASTPLELDPSDSLADLNYSQSDCPDRLASDSVSCPPSDLSLHNSNEDESSAQREALILEENDSFSCLDSYSDSTGDEPSQQSDSAHFTSKDEGLTSDTGDSQRRMTEERDDEESLVITIEDDEHEGHQDSPPTYNAAVGKGIEGDDEQGRQRSNSDASGTAQDIDEGELEEENDTEETSSGNEKQDGLELIEPTGGTLHSAPALDDGVLLPAAVPMPGTHLESFPSMDEPELRASLQELIQTRAIRMETNAARYVNNQSGGSGGGSGKAKKKSKKDKEKDERKEKKREKKAKKKTLKLNKAAPKSGKIKDKKVISPRDAAASGVPVYASLPISEDQLTTTTTSTSVSDASGDSSANSSSNQRLSMNLSERSYDNSNPSSYSAKSEPNTASDKDSRTEDLSISSADDDRLESERETESESVGGREEDADESDTFAEFDDQQEKEKTPKYVVPDPQLAKKYCLFDNVEALAGFNTNPQKGMRDMIQKGLISEAPEDVALFLYCCKRLDKAQVGEFLGDHKGLGRDVLDHFVRLFNFADLDFDIALRRFLSYFRLPGEAQKIDRIMSAFASQFYTHNKSDIFLCSDAVYILAFAVIMLNTDAHNPNVKKKMTEQEFIRTNRGINAGQDIPADFLSDIYCRITTNEIKMERESFPDALKMGWVWIKGDSLDERLVRKVSSMRLSKKKPVKLHWHRLWFILCESGLHFYQDVRLTQPVGAVSLRDVKHQVITEEADEEELRRVRENDKKKLLVSHFMFKLTTLHPGATSLGERIFYLALPTQREVDVWVALLVKCLSTLSQTVTTYSPPAVVPPSPPQSNPPAHSSSSPLHQSNSSPQSPSPSLAASTADGPAPTRDVNSASPKAAPLQSFEGGPSHQQQRYSGKLDTATDRPPVPSLTLVPSYLESTAASSPRHSPTQHAPGSPHSACTVGSTSSSPPPAINAQPGLASSLSSTSALPGAAGQRSSGVIYSTVPPPPGLWPKQGSPRHQPPPPLAGRALGRVGGNYPPPPIMSGGQLYSFSGASSPVPVPGGHHSHYHRLGDSGPPSPPTPPPEHRPVPRRVIRLKTNTSIVPPSIFDL